MEDNFRARVDKTFRALGGGLAPSAGVTSALWCITDEEIKRKEWNRSRDGVGDGDAESGPFVVRSQMELDRELSDREEEEEEGGGEIDGEKKKRRRNNGGGAEISAEEYLEVQSNIGRDCTLDYEEEEDEYDKVAVGTELRGDLPNSFHGVVRDPRANHMAAKLRLKEDAEAVANFGALQHSDNSAEIDDHEVEEVDGNVLECIPQKSENLLASGSLKYIRHLADPRSGAQLSGANGLVCKPDSNDDDGTVPEQASDLSQYSAGALDYGRNPSKYAHCTLNSSDDIDGCFNQKAYMDFSQCSSTRNTDSLMDDIPAEFPRSVTFIPKMKPQHSLLAKRSEINHNGRDECKNKGWSIDITAENAQESEKISPMEGDDERGVAIAMDCSSVKSVRQYRTRNIASVDEP